MKNFMFWNIGSNNTSIISIVTCRENNKKTSKNKNIKDQTLVESKITQVHLN